jgi:BASS family bile acid:Na+ symporter
VLLPGVAILLTKLLHPSTDGRIAILILAACPGGRFAPHLSRLARGQLSLSVEITLFLAKLTVLTAPLLTSWMLRLHHVEIHELPLLLRLLVLQLLPYVVGKQLRRRLGSRVDWLLRPLNVASLACMAGTLILLVIHHEMRTVTLLSGGDWLAVLTFAVVSLGLAWLLGGRSGPTRRAFAVTANARDLALALVIADAALAEHPVRLALFASWLLFFLFDFAFAWLAHRRGERVTTPSSPVGHEAPSAV